MNEHAKLSASGSHRWILCPGSIKAEEGFPDITNAYAEEGKFAHMIAAHVLERGGYPDNDFEISEKISDEMEETINKYVDYVHEIKKFSPPQEYSRIYVEHKVDYSNMINVGIEEGFGTPDVIITNKHTLHIIDFKYGMSKVNATENWQLLLYALGAIATLKLDPTYIELHIMQPRINSCDVWKISKDELKEWRGYLRAKAEAALAPDAPRVPNEIACKYCKANSTCPVLNDVVIKLANLISKNKITDEETRFVLDNSKLLINFIGKIEEEVYNKLIIGNPFPGYKLVNGKNIRKINPEKEDLLLEILGEKAYNKTLIGVGKLEKLVDSETLNSIVYVSTSSPILAKETDKRTAINLDELRFDPLVE